MLRALHECENWGPSDKSVVYLASLVCDLGWLLGSSPKHGWYLRGLEAYYTLTDEQVRQIVENINGRG